MNKTILITGATAGFGKAIAEKFAAASWNCILTGRRKERLNALAETLTQQYNVKVLPLCFDVQDRKAVQQVFETLPTEWQQIDVLVNNAGLALGRESFDEASLDDFDTMIDTNVKGLLYVSKAVIPYMVQRKSGHVINVSSISGKEVYPGGSVYCASKHAVGAISEGQRMDLLPHNIKVTTVNPGAAVTEFSAVRFKGDQEKFDAVYKGFTPLYAEDVAGVVFYCANLPEHVCINEVEVTCTAQANAYLTHRK